MLEELWAINGEDAPQNEQPSSVKLHGFITSGSPNAVFDRISLLGIEASRQADAPATGEALAELIAEGVVRTVDLTPFDPTRPDPTRLRPLNPSLLRSG